MKLIIGMSKRDSGNSNTVVSCIATQPFARNYIFAERLHHQVFMKFTVGRQSFSGHASRFEMTPRTVKLENLLTSGTGNKDFSSCYS